MLLSTSTTLTIVFLIMVISPAYARSNDGRSANLDKKAMENLENDPTVQQTTKAMEPLMNVPPCDQKSSVLFTNLASAQNDANEKEFLDLLTKMALFSHPLPLLTDQLCEGKEAVEQATVGTELAIILDAFCTSTSIEQLQENIKAGRTKIPLKSLIDLGIQKQREIVEKKNSDHHGRVSKRATPGEWARAAGMATWQVATCLAIPVVGSVAVLKFVVKNSAKDLLGHFSRKILSYTPGFVQTAAGAVASGANRLTRLVEARYTDGLLPWVPMVSGARWFSPAENRLKNYMRNPDNAVREVAIFCFAAIFFCTLSMYLFSAGLVPPAFAAMAMSYVCYMIFCLMSLLGGTMLQDSAVYLLLNWL